MGGRELDRAWDNVSGSDSVGEGGAEPECGVDRVRAAVSELLAVVDGASEADDEQVADTVKSGVRVLGAVRERVPL